MEKYLIYYFCIGSSILSLVCTVNSAKCEHNYPQIKVSPELIPVDNESDYHTVDPRAKSFSINCSSTDPVFWNINTKSVYEHLTVLFLVERLTTNIHSNDSEIYSPLLCHTVTLHFRKVDEGVTGIYTCANIRPGQKYLSLPLVYVYGGRTSNQSKGSLINRGKTIKMSTQNYDKEISDDFSLVIPCALNYPVNQTVELLVQKPSKSSSRSELQFDSERIVDGTLFQVFSNCPTVDCFYADTCINFEGMSDVIKASEYLREGIRINCYTETADTNYEERTDLVRIEVESSPTIAHSPTELNMTLYVDFDEPLKFKCKSTQPIVLSTNWQHDRSLHSEYLQKLYWKYQEEIKITTPSSNYSWWEQEREWQSLEVEVTCALRDQNLNYLGKITWNYRLINILGNGYEENDKNRLFKFYGGFICKSPAPDSLSAAFVPCSTFNECQMKSKFLYFPGHRYAVSNLTVSKNSVEFSIPKVTSGLIRCYGFQTEVSEILYVGLDSYRPQYSLTSSKREYHWSDAKNPLVLANVTEVFEGDYVVVNCSIPLMLVVSHPEWEFTFRNKSQILVKEEFIRISDEKTEDEIFFISAEIQLPTLEVTGIACMNLQLATATPTIWDEGIIAKESEITTETRRESVAIKVKVRPPEIKTIQIRSNSVGQNLGIGLGILGLLLTLLLAYVVWYIRNQQNIIDKLREDEVKLFREGNPELAIDDKQNANKVAQNLPYDENFEIDPLMLEIDYKTCLGSGEFGNVYKATLPEASSQVAVKCVKPGASANYIRAALSELKVMLFIKSHENVVKVIGACTQELLNHKLVVVMEFCEKGDVLSYIRKHSKGFISLVKNGKLSDSSKSPNLILDTSESSEVLSTTDLIKWAGQIANGMKYISGRNIIHGDLALRNVLLDSNLQVKISDFGLSKKLYEYSNYVRKNQTPLPWRWLAVESLTFTEFSIASDVWAYGITLWELFSLGRTPYPGQQFNSDFVHMITSGFRLPLPEYATYELYNLMLNCWNENPADRPTFIEIHSKLDPSSYKYVSL